MKRKRKMSKAGRAAISAGIRAAKLAKRAEADTKRMMSVGAERTDDYYRGRKAGRYDGRAEGLRAGLEALCKAHEVLLNAALYGREE